MSAKSVLPPVTPDSDLPIRPDDVLDDEQRNALAEDLERLAKLRRDVESDARTLRLA